MTIRRYYSALLGALLLSGGAVQALSAQTIAPSSSGTDFRIIHHEALSAFRFTAPQVIAGSADKPALAVTKLTLQAFGKKFALELQSNNQIFDNLPLAQQRNIKHSMQLYKGKITGMVGSWVRLNRSGANLAGVLWDGKELYVIDSSDQVGKAIAAGVTARASSKAYPLIYKLSDTQSNATCAVDPKTSPLTNFRGMVAELQTRVMAKAQASRKLDVAIVTDAAFTKANSANPQAAVAARMNVVDGIYTEQVGVHINVSQITTLTNDGSLTATDPELLLTQFSEYANAASFNNPGLAHLFTGRDIDGYTIGIAFIGALCNKYYGTGLSQIDATGTAGALTIAHELGHNFGAPHDSEFGSACETTPDTYLMNPVMNGSSQFSACSLQNMLPKVSSAACITNVLTKPVADIRPIFIANPINTKVSSKFVYRIEVKNGGTGAATKVTAKISIPAGLTVNSALPSFGRCTRVVGMITCNMSTLAAGATRTVTINLKAGVKPVKLLSTVQLAAGNDSNAANNAGKVAINVR
jgi:Metallo-peptidase family M12/Domain of unknown function DUF11